MADAGTIARLEEAAMNMRKNLLRLCHVAGSLHLGGDLSITEVMTALWQYKMKYDPDNLKMEDRDRFFLSKGHCAGALYIAQAMAGCYPLETVFNTYNKLDSSFGIHPCSNTLPSVEISTGALGHGLSIAVGAATIAKYRRQRHRVYVVMGDGEIQEGSIWEAAMAAAQYKLGNLVGIVDRNYLSLDGNTEDLMKLEPLADKWRAFGWNVMEIDGNDMAAVVDTLDHLPAPDTDTPTMIIARTTKGKGISFMENDPDWHAGSVDSDLLEKCFAELDGKFQGRRV
jgi:transketolase